uniref:Uncharacterized protein n=1 Tax=Rhizophora mucronata TaxID=61149 RepID=A0A2P2P739_RHIMU
MGQSLEELQVCNRGILQVHVLRAARGDCKCDL